MKGFLAEVKILVKKVDEAVFLTAEKLFPGSLLKRATKKIALALRVEVKPLK